MTAVDRRSIRAEIARAKAAVRRNVNEAEMAARIDDHRHGLHARPWRHEKHCYWCLADQRIARKQRLIDAGGRL